jgi:Fe2+ or Zn2+ uptake regulation protein
MLSTITPQRLLILRELRRRRHHGTADEILAAIHDELPGAAGFHPRTAELVISGLCADCAAA